jgi:hypothetical protein
MHSLKGPPATAVISGRGIAHGQRTATESAFLVADAHAGQPAEEIHPFSEDGLNAVDPFQTATTLIETGGPDQIQELVEGTVAVVATLLRTTGLSFSEIERICRKPGIDSGAA